MKTSPPNPHLRHRLVVVFATLFTLFLAAEGFAHAEAGPDPDRTRTHNAEKLIITDYDRAAFDVDANVDAFREAAARWPFAVHVTIRSDESSRMSFMKTISEGVYTPNMVSIGIDPTHHYTAVYFGSAIHVPKNGRDDIYAAGNSKFRRHDYVGGLIEIGNLTALSLPPIAGDSANDDYADQPAPATPSARNARDNERRARASSNIVPVRIVEEFPDRPRKMPPTSVALDDESPKAMSADSTNNPTDSKSSRGIGVFGWMLILGTGFGAYRLYKRRQQRVDGEDILTQQRTRNSVAHGYDTSKTAPFPSSTPSTSSAVSTGSLPPTPADSRTVIYRDTTPTTSPTQHQASIVDPLMLGMASMAAFEVGKTKAEVDELRRREEHRDSHDLTRMSDDGAIDLEAAHIHRTYGHSYTPLEGQDVFSPAGGMSSYDADKPKGGGSDYDEASAAATVAAETSPEITPSRFGGMSDWRSADNKPEGDATGGSADYDFNSPSEPAGGSSDFEAVESEDSKSDVGGSDDWS